MTFYEFCKKYPQIEEIVFSILDDYFYFCEMYVKKDDDYYCEMSERVYAKLQGVLETVNVIYGCAFTVTDAKRHWFNR